MESSPIMAKFIQETKNLIKIFDELNSEYFDGLVYAGIGWRRSKLGKTKVTLGSCSIEERFIRINSILQEPEIPTWFLIGIVHHEMIHAYQESALHNERFQELERQYPLYEWVQDFQLTKLPRILAGHRKKKTDE